MKKLNEPELISVNKVSVMLRCNGEKLNFAKMRAKFGQLGVMYYFYPEGDGYFMSPTKLENRNDIITSRSLAVTQSGSGTAVMLNTRELFEEETYVSTYSFQDGFLLKRSTLDEIEFFGSRSVRYVQSGHITNQLTMNLSPKDAKLLNDAFYVCVIDRQDAVKVYLKPVTENEYANTPKLKEVNPESELIIYQFPKNSRFVYFPAKFMDAEKIKKQSWMNCNWVDNEFHIELEPVICDLCKKAILRSEEKVFTYKVDSFTKDVVEILSSYVENGGAYKELRKMNRQLDGLLKQLEETK